MKKQTLINLFILFFLFSCQSYEFENIEINDTPIENNPYKVSIDEAKDIALNFMKTFQKTRRINQKRWYLDRKCRSCKSQQSSNEKRWYRKWHGHPTICSQFLQ